MNLRVAAAVLLGLVGLLWIGQGLGYVGGSFMTSDIRWAVAGVILLVAAVVVWRTGRRE